MIISSITIVVLNKSITLTGGNIFIEPILVIVTGYLLVVVDDVGVVEIGPVHERIIITCWPFSCPTYDLSWRVAGTGCRYQEDDETGQQEPAATAAGQSQGGGKCAHRPRGASQPPKPTTDGASTSFPVAFPSPLPPFLPPPWRTLSPSMPQRSVLHRVRRTFVHVCPYLLRSVK